MKSKCSYKTKLLKISAVIFILCSLFALFTGTGRAAASFPNDWDDDGIFKSYYNQAYVKLRTMSPEEKIGQLLLVRCPGENADEVIKTYKPGGFVLFKRDFEGKTKDEVLKMNQGFQRAANIPMILSTDEEGGTVVRFSSNPQIVASAFKSPQMIFENGGMEAIKADAQKKARLMKELGLNNNLAPVADVSTSPEDYIYNRTFGKSAEKTKDYVSIVVQAMQSEGIACTLKHFPGYGGNVDTHTGLSLDKRTAPSFFTKDFIPFEAGIGSGVDSIMVSHNTVECFDSRLPMSLSPATRDILRNKLNFTGVIMSDDLTMEAIKQTESSNPVVLAILAGNDMLIVTDYGEAFNSIYRAVDNGEISWEIIDRAVFKILSWKYKLGLI